jgi:alkanesulfonate monooxygenase SsuD/methylene tetrahydromethanopterin reductase-like flavin-dependent oxidoreductase (luciferase family)
LKPVTAASVSMRFGLPGGRGSLDPRGEITSRGLTQAADTQGFDCLWFSEEHFDAADVSPPRRPSSALVAAAAVAATTSRIRIGYAGVPPLHNAVRLAEDLATLDVLSSGRLDFAVATPRERYRAVFEREAGARHTVPEVVDALIQHWAGTPLVIEGIEHRVTPALVQQPHPPIYVTVTADSEPTIVWAAERGYPIILSALQTPDSLRQCLYVFAQHGGRVADAPVERFVFVAESDAAARQQAWPVVEQLTARLRTAGQQSLGGKANFEAEHFFAHTAVIGSPDTVTQRLTELRDDLGVGFVNVRPSFSGTTPLRLQVTTQTLFAAEVLPRLKAVTSS